MVFINMNYFITEELCPYSRSWDIPIPVPSLKGGPSNKNGKPLLLADMANKTIWNPLSLPLLRLSKHIPRSFSSECPQVPSSTNTRQQTSFSSSQNFSVSLVLPESYSAGLISQKLVRVPGLCEVIRLRGRWHWSLTVKSVLPLNYVVLSHWP